MAVRVFFFDKRGKFVSPNDPQFHIKRGTYDTKTKESIINLISPKTRPRKTRQLSFDSDLSLDKSDANITDVFVHFRVKTEAYDGKKKHYDEDDNKQFKYGFKLSRPITKNELDRFMDEGGILLKQIKEDIAKTPHISFKRIEFYEKKYLKHGKYMEV